MKRNLLWLLLLITPALEAREPVLGQPCEGCEEVFKGLPEQLASHGRIAPTEAEGMPLTLMGTVRDQQGLPRADVIVYAYQTDHRGMYPYAGPKDGNHGTYRGWVRTDTSGNYRFDTIRPARYPDSDLPEHIHMHVLESGCGTYYIDDVLFSDDPMLTPAFRRSMATGRGGNGIADPERIDGNWQVRRDIVLGTGIKDHDCP